MASDTPNAPARTTLSKLCIILDTSLLKDEIYMISDSIIFSHPLSLSMEECKLIVGNMSATLDILVDLQKTSVASVVDTLGCKLGILKLHNYFVVLSGPTDMSSACIVQQMELFVDALVFFLGPLTSLHIQYTSDQIKLLLRKVARHIITCIIPDRGVTFRNNVGYLPTKSSVPLECVLRCSTLIDSLGVFGGVVFHEKKIVYTNIDNNILSVLFGLEESNVPIETIPSMEKITIIRVFLMSKMWNTIKVTHCQNEPPQHTPEDIDAFLRDVEHVVETPVELKDDTSDQSAFEFVSLDLPEDEYRSNSPSKKLLRNFSSPHNKFSLINELFDNNNTRGKKGPIGRSKSLGNLEEPFTDSVESSGSNLPGNSLNYKLLTSDEDASKSSPDDGQGPDGLQHNGEVPIVQEATNIPTYEKRSDSTSNDSVYHDSLDDVEYMAPFLADIDLKDCELMLLTKVNTTIILLGDDLTDKVQRFWSACLLLLGEVSGYFNVEAKTKVQKTTQGVNSFVFNKRTKSLLYSNAGRTSPESHQQIKFCKQWCDEEADVDMVCVQGLNCTTTLKNTSSAHVYLTSRTRTLRWTKLADRLVDITGRNFDSVFL